MSPTNSEGGRRNARLTFLLASWNAMVGDSGVVFDSSTGFTMPDGAVLSPDGSWIRRQRWQAIAKRERDGYAPVVPDVCVEIVSPSQTNAEVVAKALRYRAYGAAFVLVLDPQRGSVWFDGVAPDLFPTDFSSVTDADQDEV